MKDQEKIKQDIVDQLVWDNRLEDVQIDVDYNGTTARLSGKVHSYNVRQAAEADALQIEGVLSVDNQLAVDASHQIDAPTDQEIQNHVKDSIYWNNRIDYSKIDVVVEDKVATLAGSVDAFWKKNLAADLAYGVNGIRNVNNKLSIVPTRERKDELIAKDVMAALSRNNQVDESRVTVNVNDGQITLSGAVNTWSENNAAYESALYAKGVRDIKNDILVKPV
ncbi:MAG: BON domain-containing protein [Candidatus Cyclobacteriaceae bacterium M3_2C_046]